MMFYAAVRRGVYRTRLFLAACHHEARISTARRTCVQVPGSKSQLLSDARDMQ